MIKDILRRCQIHRQKQCSDVDRIYMVSVLSICIIILSAACIIWYKFWQVHIYVSTDHEEHKMLPCVQFDLAGKHTPWTYFRFDWGRKHWQFDIIPTQRRISSKLYSEDSSEQLRGITLAWRDRGHIYEEEMKNIIKGSNDANTVLSILYLNDHGRLVPDQGLSIYAKILSSTEETISYTLAASGLKHPGLREQLIDWLKSSNEQLGDAMKQLLEEGEIEIGDGQGRAIKGNEQQQKEP